MRSLPPPAIRLRPWREGDLATLHSLNTPEMTAHLGGPETDDAVEARHARYLRTWHTGEARMFAIAGGTADLGEHAVGGIGWWKTTWHDEDVYEAGWSVIPAAQGVGVATAALALLIEDLTVHWDLEWLMALPSVDNPPSNALCAGAGFRHQGVESIPHRGGILEVNAWALGLTPRVWTQPRGEAS